MDEERIVAGKETDLGSHPPDTSAVPGRSDLLPPPIADPRLIDVVKVLTYLGGNPTSKRLNKLAYLAELESIRKRGLRLTRTRFVRYKHGPFSSDVALAAELVPEDISITEFRTRYGNKGRRHSAKKSSINVELSEDELQVLRDVIRWAKGKDTEAITQSLDNAAPFVWTQRSGDRIDFERFARLIDAADHGRKETGQGTVVRFQSPQEIREFLAAL